MERTLRLLHRAARWFVLAAVVISPWLFGCAEPWACGLVGFLAVVGASIWLFSVVCYPSQVIRVPGITLLLGLLLLLAALQALELPGRLVNRISPLSTDMASTCRETLAPASGPSETPDGALAPVGMATVSVAPLATRESAFVFVFYLGVFLVLVNCTNTWHELRREAGVVVLCGFVMAVVALVHKLSGSGQMLWFHSPRYGGSVFGPFTNRDHFAFHMNMIFGLAVGLLLASTTFQAIHAQENWRDRLAWLSTKTASQTGLLVFAVALIGATVAVTLCRGAIMSFIAAMIVGSLVVASAMRERERKRAWTLLALFLLVCGTIIWLGWQPVVDRLATLVDISMDPLKDDRGMATLDTLLVLGAFPILGCGFGAFRHIFPLFARPDLQSYRFLHAHNDWAQLLAEGGVVGGLLVLLVVFLFVRQVVRRFPVMRVHPRRFVVGSLLAIVAAAVHSLVDYSLHKPANAFLLVAVCGMILAALHLETPPEDDDGEDKGRDVGGDERGPWFGRESPARQAALRIVACLLLIGVIVMAPTALDCMRAGFSFKRLEHEERLFDRLKDPVRMENAARAGLCEVDGILAAGEPDQIRETAEVLFLWAADSRLPRNTRRDIISACVRSATRAVAVAPSDYLVWLWLARAQALAGNWDGADRYLTRARELRPQGKTVMMFTEGK